MPAWQDVVIVVLAVLVVLEILRAVRAGPPTIVLGDRAEYKFRRSWPLRLFAGLALFVAIVQREVYADSPGWIMDAVTTFFLFLAFVLIFVSWRIARSGAD